MYIYNALCARLTELNQQKKWNLSEATLRMVAEELNDLNHAIDREWGYFVHEEAENKFTIYFVTTERELRRFWAGKEIMTYLGCEENGEGIWTFRPSGDTGSSRPQLALERLAELLKECGGVELPHTSKTI